MAASDFKRRRAAKWRSLVEAFVERQFCRVLGCAPSCGGVSEADEDEEGRRITADNKRRAVAFFLSGIETHNYGSVSPTKVIGELEEMQRQLEVYQQPFKAAALGAAWRTLLAEGEVGELAGSSFRREHLCNCLWLLLLLARREGTASDADFAPRKRQLGNSWPETTVEAAALKDFAFLLSEQRADFEREMNAEVKSNEAWNSDWSELSCEQDTEEETKEDWSARDQPSALQLPQRFKELHGKGRLPSLVNKQRDLILQKQKRRFERLGVAEDALAKLDAEDRERKQEKALASREDAANVLECILMKREYLKWAGVRPVSVAVSQSGCAGKAETAVLSLPALSLQRATTFGVKEVSFVEGRKIHFVSEAWIIERVLTVLSGADAEPLFDRTSALSSGRGEFTSGFREVSETISSGVPLALRINSAVGVSVFVPHFSGRSLESCLSAFLPAASAVLLLQRLQNRLHFTDKLRKSAGSSSEGAVRRRTVSAPERRAAIAAAAAFSAAVDFEESQRRRLPCSLAELSQEAPSVSTGEFWSSSSSWSWSGLGATFEAFLYGVRLLDRQWKAQLLLLRRRQLRTLRSEWGFGGKAEEDGTLMHEVWSETQRTAEAGPFAKLALLAREEDAEAKEAHVVGERQPTIGVCPSRRRPMSLFWLLAQLEESLRMWTTLAELTDFVLRVARLSRGQPDAVASALLSRLLLNLQRSEVEGSEQGQRLWRFLFSQTSSPLMQHLDTLLSLGLVAHPLAEFKLYTECTNTAHGACNSWLPTLRRCLYSAEEAGRALTAASAVDQAAEALALAGNRKTRLAEKEQSAAPLLSQKEIEENAPLTAALLKGATALLSAQTPEGRSADSLPSLDLNAELLELAEAERVTTAADSEPSALQVLRSAPLKKFQKYFSQWQELPTSRRTKDKDRPRGHKAHALSGGAKNPQKFEGQKESFDSREVEVSTEEGDSDEASAEEGLCLSAVFLEEQVAIPLYRQRKLGAEFVFLKCLGDGCALELMLCLRGFFSLLGEVCLLPVLKQFFLRADAPLAHADPLLIERLLQEAFFGDAKDGAASGLLEKSQEVHRQSALSECIHAILSEALTQCRQRRGEDDEVRSLFRICDEDEALPSVGELSPLEERASLERRSLRLRLFSLPRVRAALRLVCLSLEAGSSLLGWRTSHASSFSSLQIRLRGATLLTRATVQPIALDAATCLFCHGLELRRALLVTIHLEKAAAPFAALFHWRRRLRLKKARKETATNTSSLSLPTDACAGEEAVCSLQQVLSTARLELLHCLGHLTSHRALVLSATQQAVLKLLTECSSLEALSSCFSLHLLFLLFVTLAPLSSEAAAVAESSAALAAESVGRWVEINVLEKARRAAALPSSRVVFFLNAAAAPHVCTLTQAPIQLLQILTRVAEAASVALPSLTLLPGDEEPLFLDLASATHLQQAATGAQTPRLYRHSADSGALGKDSREEKNLARLRANLNTLDNASLEAIRSLTQSAEAVLFNCRRAAAALVSLTATAASALPSEGTALAAVASARECCGAACRSGEERSQLQQQPLELGGCVQASELLAALHCALDGNGFYSSRLKEAYAQRTRCPDTH